MARFVEAWSFLIKLLDFLIKNNNNYISLSSDWILEKLGNH